MIYSERSYCSRHLRFYAVAYGNVHLFQLDHLAQALRIYRLRISKSGPEKKQGEQGVIDQGETPEHGTDKHDAPSQANIE